MYIYINFVQYFELYNIYNIKYIQNIKIILSTRYIVEYDYIICMYLLYRNIYYTKKNIVKLFHINLKLFIMIK